MKKKESNNYTLPFLSRVKNCHARHTLIPSVVLKYKYHTSQINTISNVFVADY